MHFTEKIVVGAYDLAMKIGAWFRRHRERGWFTPRKIRWAIVIVLVLYFGSRVAVHVITAQGIPVSAVEVVPARLPVFKQYVGQVQSMQNVELRARVEGFLEQRLFEEGSDVNKDDVLFIIEREPYEAALLEAKGQLAKDEAALAYAQEQVKRYEPLAKKDYVSREQYDKYVTQAAELAAAVEADRGSLARAELSLSYCTVTAPFAGRIGRRFVDNGNLVGAGEMTKLATLVQMDPIFVYFSPSEKETKDMLSYLRDGPLSAGVVFADGSAYAYKGNVNFVDNVVNTSTSTVVMRAVMPNPDSLLIPGMYVTAKIELTELPQALSVPQNAVQEDQGGTYVMLVEGGKRLKRQHVTLGDIYDDQQHVVEGLKAGDVVVTSRLQIVKPGMKVWPKIVAKDTTLKGIVRRAIRGY